MVKNKKSCHLNQRSISMRFWGQTNCLFENLIYVNNFNLKKKTKITVERRKVWL